MTQSPQMPEAMIGRRGRPRLRLGVPARLTTLEGTRDVLLNNLSSSGAQVRLAAGEKFTSGVLEWLQFDALVDLIWQEANTCGVRFDEPLPKRVILATRDAAPGLVDEEHGVRLFAKRWSEGTYK